MAWKPNKYGRFLQLQSFIRISCRFQKWLLLSISQQNVLFLTGSPSYTLKTWQRRDWEVVNPGFFWTDQTNDSLTICFQKTRGFLYGKLVNMWFLVFMFKFQVCLLDARWWRARWPCASRLESGGGMDENQPVHNSESRIEQKKTIYIYIYVYNI